MKKIIVLVLALVIGASATGCASATLRVNALGVKVNADVSIWEIDIPKKSTPGNKVIVKSKPKYQRYTGQ